MFGMKIIQECKTLTEWQEVMVASSQGDKEYLVLLPPWDRTEKEAVCECQSYEYRGKCRHQREALSMICSWSELDGKKQTPDERKGHLCPDCGGPTNMVVLSV